MGVAAPGGGFVPQKKGLFDVDVVDVDLVDRGSNIPLLGVNFGTVGFSAAMVNGQPIGNFNPDRINMVSGTTTKAATSTLSGGTAFSVAWKHAYPGTGSGGNLIPMAAALPKDWKAQVDDFLDTRRSRRFAAAVS